MSERLRRNRLVTDEPRSAGGVVGGDFEGAPLLLLTTAGAETYKVTAAETEGAERERLRARQLPATQYFAGFQEQAGRRIPVVTLTRVDT
jgi:hypothetical protein